MALALLLGFVAVLAAAVFHNVALEQISRRTPRENLGRQATSLVVFGLLALVHIVEISAFAVYVYFLEVFLWPESFPGTVGFADIVYFSGINFTTLGMTQVEVAGPLRFVTMLQSLAGFMLLTWSAGYLYAAVGKYWRNE